MLKRTGKDLNVALIVLKAILIYLITVFILYPNINLLINVFYKNGSFSTQAFSKIIKSQRALKSMTNSFILAVSMIITVNITGIFCVFLTEYWKIRGAKILKFGYMSSLVYGGVTLVTGYKFIYGSNGILTKLLIRLIPSLDPGWFVGYWAVIFIMTFACTSNHIIFLTNAVRDLDGHVIEAAKNMGANGFTILFKIVLPILKPTLFAITILTFLTGLSAMSAPLIVGGTDFQTINPMIISFAKSPYSREIAALLAVILGTATIILLSIMNKIEKGGNYISVSKTKIPLAKQRIHNPFCNILAHAVAFILFCIYMAPITFVVLFSFCKPLDVKQGRIDFSALTFENYKTLFTSAQAFKPYLVSIAYALSAAVIAAVLAVIVAKIVHKSKNKADAFFEYAVLIPWLLPSTLIALGLMLTYDTPRFILGNKVLIGTLGIMLIAYIVVRLPFTFRMIKAAFFGIDDNLEEAAQSMGSGTLYTMLHVIVPVILPAIISVIVLNFNSLLSDYDISVFLYHPLFQPLGIVIKSASDETATTNAEAMTFVYSVVLIIISSAALYFAQRLMRQRKKAK